MIQTELTYFLAPESNAPEIPLQPGKEYLIGRSPACTILLSDGAVSREHARLVFESTGFVLKDLGSTNGTKVNGETMESQVLESLDRLTFGRIGFTYKIRRKTAAGNITLSPSDTALLDSELQDIIDSLDEPAIQQQLRNFREKFSRARKNLINLAYNDDLTGLYNRRFFDRTLENELRRSIRYSRPLTMIMVDIDHFKLFNDKYGHQKGDSVLRTVGTILRENCRSSDIVCRYGGEEMAVILPEQDLTHGENTAEKLRKLLAVEAKEIEGVEITASFGVSTLGNKDDTVEFLIRRSDQALYEAKEAGRNCTRCQI